MHKLIHGCLLEISIKTFEIKTSSLLCKCDKLTYSFLISLQDLIDNTNTIYNIKEIKRIFNNNNFHSIVILYIK